MADQGVSARLVASDGTSYELSGEQTLGRSKDADITISDPKISRSHARFKLDGAQLTVEDLGSANGTRVNQRKIDGPATLANGDTISFDTVDLRVELIGADAAPDEPEDATIIGSLDGDATMVSMAAPEPAPEPAPAPEPEPAPAPDAAPAPPPTGKVSAAAKSGGAAEVPESWVDEGTGSETQFLTPDMAAKIAEMSDINVAAASDLPHLIVVNDDGSQQVVELETGADGPDVWEIGRDSSCQIVLGQVGVSGRHAQLVHEDGRWRIVNLVSTNSIFVNGEKRPKAYLSDDDKIGLGEAKLVFKAGKGGAAARPAGAKAGAGGGAAAKGGGMSPAVIGGIVAVLVVAAAAAYFLLG